MLIAARHLEEGQVLVVGQGISYEIANLVVVPPFHENDATTFKVYLKYFYHPFIFHEADVVEIVENKMQCV